MPVRRSLGEHGWRRPGRPWVGPSRPPTRSARADRPRRPATQPPNGPGGLRRWAGGGGLYSYDRLENLFGLGFRSADRIIPELQTLAVGPGVAGAQRLRSTAVVPGHRRPAGPRRWSWVPTATGTRRWSSAFPGRP